MSSDAKIGEHQPKMEPGEVTYIIDGNGLLAVARSRSSAKVSLKAEVIIQGQGHLKDAYWVKVNQGGQFIKDW